MSLLTRLLDPLEEEERIPYHEFVAGIREFQRGEVTQQQFFTFYGLSPAEETALQAWYVAQIVSGNLTTEEVEDILRLRGSGAYSVATATARLGL